MILGLSIPHFTVLHVAISLMAIVAGLLAMSAFAAGRRRPLLDHLFLVTTALTTLTGFLFPIVAFTPALGTGIVSTLVLALAFWAFYGAQLKGAAGTIYAVSATTALWLNLFVLVVQSFLKVPALHTLAPNGNEPAFLAAQALALGAMILLGWAAVRTVRRPVAIGAA